MSRDDTLGSALREAERFTERLSRVLQHRPGRLADAPAEVRRAAVAIVLAPDENGPELLLIRRAEWEGDPWSGQVALPGGRSESADPTLWHTAARETREETGMDILRDARLLGTLDELYPQTPELPRIVVRPHVVFMPGKPKLTLSDEVAAAFWAPVSSLRHPASTFDATVHVRGQDRTVAGIRHGDYTIWGMTERILRDFFQRVAD